MTESPRVHADSPTEGRREHYDKDAGATAIWIYQGDFYVSARPELFLTTVLGSCVAVCIRDPVARCGGMNHFLLPDAKDRQESFPSLALRYGSYSIERLINAILSRGGNRQRLEIKVFGGANVTSSGADIGARNVDFIEHYFAKERLPIVAADLRGKSARKLRYFPTTGLAQVRNLVESDAAEAMNTEEILRKRLSTTAKPGKAEIF